MAYELEHKTKRQISTGRYYPLGATLYENGVNFAIYSQYAIWSIFSYLIDQMVNQQTSSSSRIAQSIYGIHLSMV